jgi:hypothetical protein
MLRTYHRVADHRLQGHHPLADANARSWLTYFFVFRGSFLRVQVNDAFGHPWPKYTPLDTGCKMDHVPFGPACKKSFQPGMQKPRSFGPLEQSLRLPGPEYFGLLVVGPVYRDGWD